MPCRDGGRGWVMQLQAKGCPELPATNQKLWKCKEGFYLESQKEHDAADRLISEFQAPEM